MDIYVYCNARWVDGLNENGNLSMGGCNRDWSGMVGW